MHELACPTCGTPSSYDFRDYILMCGYCSASFRFEQTTGYKEIFSDHFIVPNTADPKAIKSLVEEWLKRLYHRPDAAAHDFAITDIRGISLPFWVSSIEAHTYWKGMVKRHSRSRAELNPGGEYLSEAGRFRRSYRWAISARSNLCEFWGMTNLHQPQENVVVSWDGFPMDSTFSRGRIVESEVGDQSAYDSREAFDFKYSNGMALSGIQIDEEEALRRAETHITTYHSQIAKLNVDHLVDIRNEFDVAGIQLMHLPYWHAEYVYMPKNALRHFYKPVPKNILIEGFGKGVLNGELAMVHSEKAVVNSYVSVGVAVVFLLLGVAWHSAFLMVALFAVGIAIFGFSKAIPKKPTKNPSDAPESQKLADEGAT
jgi:hypothetical protein